ERAFDGTPFLKNVPSTQRDKFAVFPERFTCSINAPVTKPLDPKSQIASGGLVSYLIFGVPLYYVYESVSS
ncbi:MAG TPA: hypothetical protein VJV05_18500, partial [Pyrinomonadaceae bacterium]|nr:hypothetical protein [Pyrinomonadaceae bacterium]